MNIYDEYNNSSNRAVFFRELKENNEKIELWNSMNDSDKKSLLSWLTISDIKDFLFSLSSDEVKKAFEYMDKNKVWGIYKSLSDDEKKEMASLIGSRLEELIGVKNDIQSNIDKANDNIVRASNDIVNARASIVAAKDRISEIKKEIKANKVELKRATKDEKKKYQKMLRASKCSPLDKIGIIARYRANRLASITEEYNKAVSNTNNLRENDANLNIELSDKRKEIKDARDSIKLYTEEIKDNSNELNSSAVNLGKINATIKNLSSSEKKMLGRKLYSKIATDRIMKTSKLKNKSSISSVVRSDDAVVKTSDDVGVVHGDVVDTRSNVDNAMGTISNLSNNGVNFYPPIPISPTVNFTMGGNREPVNNISMEQLVMICSTMQYYIMMQMNQQLKNQQVQGNDMNQGYSRVHSKGNVSILFLAGIIIMLLCMYFFII